jgi:hypothetical protein
MADGGAKVEEVWREVSGLKAQLSDCCPKVKKDLTNLEQELAKLKEEIRTMKPKPQLVVPPAAHVAVPPAPKAAAPTQKPSSRPPPPRVAPPSPKPVPVKVMPPSIPAKQAKQFPPSMKKGRPHFDDDKVTDEMYDVPHRIIAHLTTECGGNVHDRHVLEVTSGSFEQETYGANPHSGACLNDPSFAAKNAADLETDFRFYSAYRRKREDIPHTRNNWVCYDFKKRRIVPTHYAIPAHLGDPGNSHLKSWVVETSVDGEKWREVAREENNE